MQVFRYIQLSFRVRAINWKLHVKEMSEILLELLKYNEEGWYTCPIAGSGPGTPGSER